MRRCIQLLSLNYTTFVILQNAMQIEGVLKTRKNLETLNLRLLKVLSGIVKNLQPFTREKNSQ